jgi:endonuclease/exonuclease/phosphatase family metal-dependent hydrolase
MLTLVSWNIQYGKGVDGQIDLSRISQTVHKDGLPDILCLQEVSRNYPSTDDGADHITVQFMTVPLEKVKDANNLGT